MPVGSLGEVSGSTNLTMPHLDHSVGFVIGAQLGQPLMMQTICCPSANACMCGRGIPHAYWCKPHVACHQFVFTNHGLCICGQCIHLCLLMRALHVVPSHVVVGLVWQPIINDIVSHRVMAPISVVPCDTYLMMQRPPPCHTSRSPPYMSSLVCTLVSVASR